MSSTMVTAAIVMDNLMCEATRRVWLHILCKPRKDEHVLTTLARQNKLISQDKFKSRFLVSCFRGVKEDQNKTHAVYLNYLESEYSNCIKIKLSYILEANDTLLETVFDVDESISLLLASRKHLNFKFCRLTSSDLDFDLLGDMPAILEVEDLDTHQRFKFPIIVQDAHYTDILVDYLFFNVKRSWQDGLLLGYSCGRARVSKRYVEVDLYDNIKHLMLHKVSPLAHFQDLVESSCLTLKLRVNSKYVRKSFNLVDFLAPVNRHTYLVLKADFFKEVDFVIEVYDEEKYIQGVSLITCQGLPRYLLRFLKGGVLLDKES